MNLLILTLTKTQAIQVFLAKLYPNSLHNLVQSVLRIILRGSQKLLKIELSTEWVQKLRNLRYQIAKKRSQIQSAHCLGFFGVFKASKMFDDV